MGRIFRSWCVLSVVALGAACGTDNDDFPDDPDLPDAGPPSDSAPPNDVPDGPISDAADADPPVITIISPESGSIHRGTILVEATVVDESQPITVAATIGPLPVTMVRQGSTDTYRGSFDSTPLAGLVAPTVIVRAEDNGGLTAELGIQILLDNEGPVASLDPAPVRLKSEAGECSREFDPLGGDAPDDGQVVPQLFELRGRVVDVGNTGTVDPQATLFFFKAGLASAELYVFDDTTKPLVVDTDGDTVCDEINPNVVPTTIPMASNEAAAVDLVPIEPTGSAFFALGEGFGGFNNTLCTSGDEVEAPDRVCLGESSTVIINDLDGSAQIFGLPQVDEFNCMGFAFDALAQNISDGFACVALRVVDKLGNVSVSEPLRICIDSDLSGGDCLGTSLGNTVAAGSRPNCTGTFTGGVVNNTACTPRRFFRSATAEEFELVVE